MVNINDREAAPYPGDNSVWRVIWKEQEELHYHYRNIEWEKGIGYGVLRADGLDRDVVRSINSPYFQYYLKDLKWRFVEEMQEAKEAQLQGDMEHFKEELTDALHFMMELNVVLNIIHSELFSRSGVSGTSSIYFYGLAANCLKNKPWKKTEQHTDFNKYLILVKHGNDKFRQELLSVMELYEIWELYSKKHQVNQFRIESQY